MRLNIFRRDKKEAEAPEVQVPLPKSFQEQVWDAPATFNRATRRRVHLWGRIWRWDLNATEDTRRVYTPRYIRRHFGADKFLSPKTRRQRRERAVIARIIAKTGVGS